MIVEVTEARVRAAGKAKEDAGEEAQDVDAAPEAAEPVAPAPPPATTDSAAPEAPPAATSPTIDDALPEDRYLNRELSWLDFNARVLALAADPSLPLLERAKFLAIFSSNLDEFYMVRVAGLKRRDEMGLSVRSADGLSPREQLRRISERTQQITSRQSHVFLDSVRPALADEGQLLTRRQTVGRADRQSHLVAALEAGDPHHVELVEVGGEDRQELGAFQQGQRRVGGQREHTRIAVSYTHLTLPTTPYV